MGGAEGRLHRGLEPTLGLVVIDDGSDLKKGSLGTRN